MSQNVQSGLEDVWTGRPAFDDPHLFVDVHETIRDHRKSKRKIVALCYECMENPRMEPRNVDDKDPDFKDRPQRCEECQYKRQLRLTAAKSAKGGY
jgi:hypothetical protein